jgi:LemA protein
MAISTQQLLLLAAAALLVFWVLGAHNRLVALQRLVHVRPGSEDAVALRLHLADEEGALDAVLTAQQQLQPAADALRARPAAAPRAAALVSAEAALAPALSRLLALLEQRSDLAGTDDLEAHVVALRDAAQRLNFARQLFNDAVRSYNAAAQQFPTRLLSRLFGFGAAGTL